MCKAQLNEILLYKEYKAYALPQHQRAYWE